MAPGALNGCMLTVFTTPGLKVLCPGLAALVSHSGPQFNTREPLPLQVGVWSWTSEFSMLLS